VGEEKEEGKEKEKEKNPASPHPLENEDPFDQETLKQNIEDFKTLVKTAIPKIRNNFDDPRSVDLSKIIVQNNGQLLDEPAKHRLWNKLVKLWGIRGWRYSMIQSVFKVCAKEVLTAQIDGDLFPYFEKTLTNYCNQNAEILTANSRK
jgi:hypothetical protein